MHLKIIYCDCFKWFKKYEFEINTTLENIQKVLKTELNIKIYWNLVILNFQTERQDVYEVNQVTKLLVWDVPPFESMQGWACEV